MRLFDTSSFEIKEQSNPKSIFYVDHLYSRWLSDGTRDTSAEYILQIDHENDFSSVVDDLLLRMSNTEILVLNPAEREYLARFCVRMLLRNPSFIEWFMHHWEFRAARFFFWLSLKFRPSALTAIKKSKLSVSDAVDAEMRAFTATADVDGFVDNLLRDRKIIFLAPRNRERGIVLGKRPYLLQRKKWYQDENGDWRYEVGLTDIYVVLDPNLMVGIVSEADEDEFRFLDDADIIRINGLIVKYSEEVVARSATDLEGAWYKIFEGEEDIREAKNLPDGVDHVTLSVEAVSTE